LPVEPEGGAINLPDHPHSIEFNNVQIKHRDRTARLHFKLEAGQKILANVSSHALQQFFTDLIRHYDTPAQGHVLLDSQDVHDLHMHRLRDQILVVDNVMMLECSILDYLRIYKTDISRAEIMDVLAKVHLDHIIVDLEDGLDTVLTPDGYPLSVSELVRLKLAAALVNTPTILVLTEIFDLVGSHFRHNILRQLADSDEFTLIYFSNRNDIDYFDAYLYMDFDKQTLFTDMNAYCAYQKEQSERCYATYVQKPKVPIKATKAKPRKKSEPPVSPTSSEES
jgi:putative ABC transport system ATP-binding protein